MDLFLAKIEDLKRHAELLNSLKRNCRCEQGGQGIQIQTPLPASKRPKRDVAGSSLPSPSLHAQVVQDYPYEVDGVGDWVSYFKEEAGPWTGPPLVVLSLFDGLGGIWQALTILGIPFSGYSSEVEQTAIQVVKKKHPSVKHVGDITKLKLSDIPEKLDLVIGGFPCQDLSVMGKKEGLHGRRSKLFFDLLRVIRDFQPKWFLVENVASMSWIDREEISRHIGLPPLELDSQELTASKRRRLYWTNIPHPPHLPQLRDHPTAQLQHCLENAIAIEHKCGVILCSNLYKGSTARLEFVLDSKTKLPRYMRPPEVEVLMGYPRDYTNVVVKKKIDQVPYVRSPKTPKAKPPPSPAPPESTRQLRKNRMSRNFFQPEVWETKITKQGGLKDTERWNLLGNTFSVKVIAYLTSPLLQSPIRSRGKPVNITGSVKEEELSAMEPGDVWALFNENGKPNWYAVIKSRTGDRFSPIPDHSRKKIARKTPLKVEMQYLELTDNYLENEVDGWNSQRGTGLFKLRSIVDVQTSWQAFSHRVTSFSKFEDSYFVYPGNDEVWSIWCHAHQYRYFVYVVDSTTNREKLLADKPGEEKFVARCIVLLKTTDHEVFRKTDTEVVFRELEKFEFRAPFHLKQEAGLLKVEVSGLKGRIKSRAASEEELDDEYDAPEENEDADGLTAEELMAEEDLEAELATLVDSAANGAGTSDRSAGSPVEV